MIAATVIASVGKPAITNQQAVASAKPSTIAVSGLSFLASAVTGTVTRMIVQASTVSMISKRSNFR